MRKLIFKEIRILSYKEKKARRIVFDREKTLITGENDTGKSTLLKSIYYTLGAEAKGISKEWKKIQPIFSLNFSLENKDYSVIRIDKQFAFFDGSENLIGKFDSITKGVAPFLANLLDYRIQIKDQSRVAITPPPQYMFIPFYIDQDSSWNNTWSSFDKLGQLSDWKESVITYSAGIKSNEYYLLQKELNKLNSDLVNQKQKAKILDNTLSTINENFASTNFEMSLSEFKEEISHLLSETSELRKSQNEVRYKLIEYHNLRSNILEQIEITKKAIKEISNDYEFVIEEVSNQIIECPTCGADYENNFQERFEIAKDENKCRDLLIILNRELNEVEKKIENEKNKYDEKIEQMNKITDILKTEKGEIQLEEILQMEGKRKIKTFVSTELNKIALEKDVTEKSIKELKVKFQNIEKKSKKKEITQKYINYMDEYTRKLSVKKTESNRILEDMSAKLEASGSELPRSLLAYYFSMLQLMNEYYPSAYCPIVIDSPNQQDQDQSNIKKIYTFITDNLPENSQVILGVADTYGIKFNFKEIRLDKKYELLNSNEFNDVNRLIKKQFDQVMGLVV